MEAGGCRAQDGRREISSASAQVEPSPPPPSRTFSSLPVLVCLGISIKQAHQQRRLSSWLEVLVKT